MPHGWTIIEGTPPWLADHWDNPAEFKRLVHEKVTGCKAALDHVYFAQGSEHTALALISFCGTVDNARDAFACVQKAFETERVNLFLSTVEKMEEQHSS